MVVAVNTLGLKAVTIYLSSLAPRFGRPHLALQDDLPNLAPVESQLERHRVRSRHWELSQLFDPVVEKSVLLCSQCLKQDAVC